jgi:hypothetical protein
LSFYAAGEKNHKYQTPTKVSCSICRTPIMDEGRNMCLLFPQLIDLSGSPDEQRHRMQHFCQRKFNILTRANIGSN